MILACCSFCSSVMTCRERESATVNHHDCKLNWLQIASGHFLYNCFLNLDEVKLHVPVKPQWKEGFKKKIEQYYDYQHENQPEKIKGMVIEEKVLLKNIQDSTAPA